jgi:PAS domain S-box-containing protein
MIGMIERRATEQQRDREALLASETKYRSIFENAIEGIYQSSPEGRFIDVNPAMARILGYDSPQEVLEAYTDMRMQLYVEPGDRDKLQSMFHTEGRAERFETRMYRRDGEVIWVSITASTVRDDQGSPLYYEGIFEDITGRKRAEQEIRRLNEELEQRVVERTAELEAVNRELQDFAYAVSHDLKAPLRAINQLAGWVNADYGEVLGQDGKSHLVLLMGRVRRMHALIEGILQYSRIGRVREKKKEVDLDFLAREVIDLVSPPQHINIIIEGRLPIIVGEPTRLAQLFQNLLDNAIKYMDKPNGKVIIDCLEHDGQWTFRMSDNGPGIEQKYYEKIFQIFQTLAPRDESENTGIGLALVKRIVEMNGGRIWLESELGKGTTFWFTIPKRG